MYLGGGTGKFSGKKKKRKARIQEENFSRRSIPFSG
jgi:hypothetical protein